MGIDLDWMAANEAIEKLQEMLDNAEHGKRAKIADEIIVAVDKICKENLSKQNFMKDKLNRLDAILNELQLDEYLNEDALPKIGEARGVVNVLLNQLLYT